MNSKDVDPVEAFRDLKDAGPGAVCEECGHFAGRHADNGGNNRVCHFPYEGAACFCRGMVWQGYLFVMQFGSGPAYIKEKL